ncbi:MAG: hypothetical protein JW809_11925 [Pirellulales bacterium]|nr:hypothetical protein [Pirellulales bacterium]
MTYLVGTDEAGYGPNLGPLVVSASVWHVPDGFDPEGLYAALADAVAPSAGEASARRVAIADSKKLYSPGGGLRHLERGLLVAMRLLGKPAAHARELFDALDPASAPERDELPWHADRDEAIPIDAKPDEIAELVAHVRRALDAAGVRLVDLRSRAVFPAAFNRLVTRFDSKGHALSHVTLSLLADALARLPDGPVRAVCDKHGGRDRYGPLLAEHFPDALSEVHQESRAVSRYRVGPRERRADLAFQAKGETWLPAALASMASKYLRELSMRAFNAFWRGRIEGLRPTAGYPQDARRFRADIAAARAELAIADDLLWRIR